MSPFFLWPNRPRPRLRTENISKHYRPFGYQKQVVLHQAEVQTDLDSISRFLSVSEDTHIVDLPLNRGTVNVLLRMKGLGGSQYTLKDLEKVSLSELVRQKNAARRTLFEVGELCLYTGIKMMP